MKKSPSLSWFIAFFSCIIFCSSLEAKIKKADWPFYTRDLINSRNAKKTPFNTKTIKDLKMLWQFDTEGPVTMNPSVVDNVLYFGDIAGFFYAVDANSGSLIWKRSLNNPSNPGMLSQILVSPAVGKKFVYVGTNDSQVFSLDRRTGEIQWTRQVFNPEQNLIQSPLGFIEEEDLLTIQGCVSGIPPESGKDISSLRKYRRNALGIPNNGNSS